MTSKAEQIVNGCMDTQEFAGLGCRLETPHPTLPHGVLPRYHGRLR